MERDSGFLSLGRAGLKRFSVSRNRRTALSICFYAIPDGKPLHTFPGIALAENSSGKRWADARRLIIDVFAIKSNKLPQARRIEHADMALAEFEKLSLAQFPQHSIDVNRSKAKGVSEVVLGERAFKAAAIDSANSLQTRGQLEQQMRCPLQGAAS